MAGLIPKFQVLRHKAQTILPWPVFDYIDGGADDEITLIRNREAWRNIRMVPRVMRNIQKVDTSCVLYGERLAAPLMIAPMALHGNVHKEGECGTARAAEKCGIPLCVSLFASKDLEDILQSGSKSLLFQQMYLLNHDPFVKSFLKGVYKNGCRSVILTVDAPIMGNRERDIESKFTLANSMFAISKRTKFLEEIGSSGDFMQLFKEKVTDCDWSVISWMKSICDIRVLIKGILHPADALLAIENGADGIIVSNHGGRQLDGTVTAVDVLPEIAKVVNKRVPILADGGIQRGTDIVKALALGATAVLIGRPILYALATDGSDGVHKLLEELKQEFKTALTLCGFSSVDTITPDVVQNRPS